MKPWGSQVSLSLFSSESPYGTEKRLAGGPGGGNERPWSPHGRGEIFGTEAPPMATTQRLGDALDYSSCGTSWARTCRPRYPDAPRRPFVRTSSCVTSVCHGRIDQAPS